MDTFAHTLSGPAPVVGWWDKALSLYSTDAPPTRDMPAVQDIGCGYVTHSRTVCVIQTQPHVHRYTEFWPNSTSTL